jgi:hypothetical protein
MQALIAKLVASLPVMPWVVNDGWHRLLAFLGLGA